ncbi:hypothetical protein B0T09DRAFT_73821 [Sordaria sp. MPI-SDFR-AT-0083]|nr:hypothetical protein B0T09DRAFT_73821 [Sordaria sp. MPI-SDFR-AT-0083]
MYVTVCVLHSHASCAPPLSLHVVFRLTALSTFHFSCRLPMLFGPILFRVTPMLVLLVLANYSPLVGRLHPSSVCRPFTIHHSPSIHLHWLVEDVLPCRPLVLATPYPVPRICPSRSQLHTSRIQAHAPRQQAYKQGTVLAFLSCHSTHSSISQDWISGLDPRIRPQDTRIRRIPGSQYRSTAVQQYTATRNDSTLYQETSTKASI